MSHSTKYNRVLRRTCTTFIVAVIGGVALGCFDADPRSVRGALDAAARAIEANDARALFRVIDRRSGDALASIVKDRARAARLIRADYPTAEQAAALRALGDGLDVGDPAALFAKRCTTACLADLGAKLGAPVKQAEHGDELEVQTSRGGSLRMHLAHDGWWGIVWNREPLFAERARAARELTQIRTNAEIYRRRQVLEAGQTH
jgi:hypothetical protein